MTSIDVMAFGAHPDDVEISCGGTVIKLCDAGRKVVVVDVVRGELGTRGSAETRQHEAEISSKILGIHARENLRLEDGNIHISAEAKRKVAEVIRKWRPEAVFLPYWNDRHPDHYNASNLIYEGIFLAGLPRYDTGQESFRPKRLYYTMGWYEFDPTFIVDISEQAERKMDAIFAFETQFKRTASNDPQTNLTSPDTEWLIRSRMAHHGSLIRKKYGEGFLIRGRITLDDPLDLSFSSF